VAFLFHGITTESFFLDLLEAAVRDSCRRRWLLMTATEFSWPLWAKRALSQAKKKATFHHAAFSI
jgi:hypothetical protein